MSPLPEAVLRERVQALQLRYVHTIDEDDLEQWPAFFCDPCLYRITHRDDFERGRPFGMVYACLLYTSDAADEE